MVYSARRFILSLASCYFDLLFFSPFSIVITSFGKVRTNLRTFVRFALVWFRLFPLPLDVWKGLRLVTVALSGLFFYLFCLLVSPEVKRAEILVATFCSSGQGFESC